MMLEGYPGGTRILGSLGVEGKMSFPGPPSYIQLATGYRIQPTGYRNRRMQMPGYRMKGYIG